MATTLYVGNIPWSTTEDQLHEIFSRVGEVQACRIITERSTGRSRGYGFVEVNEEDVERFIEQTNGMELENRRLVVNSAKTKEQNRE